LGRLTNVQLSTSQFFSGSNYQSVTLQINNQITLVANDGVTTVVLPLSGAHTYPSLCMTRRFDVAAPVLLLCSADGV
jgi:hypothetical protein